jgi:hypothetical protein
MSAEDVIAVPGGAGGKSAAAPSKRTKPTVMYLGRCVRASAALPASIGAYNGALRDPPLLRSREYDMLRVLVAELPLNAPLCR